METGAILERPEGALHVQEAQGNQEQAEACVGTLMAKFGELTLDEQHTLCEAVDLHGRSLVREIFDTLDLPSELLEGKELIPQLKDTVNELQKDSSTESNHGDQESSARLRFAHSLIRAMRSEKDEEDPEQIADSNPWEKKEDSLLSPEFLEDISDFFDKYDTQFNDPEFALHGDTNLYAVYYDKRATSNSSYFQFYPNTDSGRPQTRNQVSLGSFHNLSEFKHSCESFKKLVDYIKNTSIQMMLPKHLDPRYPCLVAEYARGGKLWGTHTTRKDAGVVGVRIGEYGTYEEEVQHFKEYIDRTFSSIRTASEVLSRYKDYR